MPSRRAARRVGSLCFFTNAITCENAWTQILNMSRKRKIPMRLAALSVGVKRVQEAKRVRGLFP